MTNRDYTFLEYKDDSTYENQLVSCTTLTEWRTEATWSPQLIQKQHLTRLNTISWCKPLTSHHLNLPFLLSLPGFLIEDKLIYPKIVCVTQEVFIPWRNLKFESTRTYIFLCEVFDSNVWGPLPTWDTSSKTKGPHSSIYCPTAHCSGREKEMRTKDSLCMNAPCACSLSSLNT